MSLSTLGPSWLISSVSFSGIHGQRALYIADVCVY